MFAKISVKGSDKHALYAFLTESETNPGFSGRIQWNFTKFFIGRDGSVVNRFEPKTVPDAPEVIAAIEKALRIEVLSGLLRFPFPEGDFGMTHDPFHPPGKGKLWLSDHRAWAERAVI